MPAVTAYKSIKGTQAYNSSLILHIKMAWDSLKFSHISYDKYAHI